MISVLCIFEVQCPLPLNRITLGEHKSETTTELRPCIRRFFPKFWFSRVSEIDFFQILVMSDSRKLVLTLIFAKNRGFSRKFAKIRVGTSRNGNVRLPNPSRLAKTRPDSKTDSKVRLKVRNAGP